jgi:hypothetical protein
MRYWRPLTLLALKQTTADKSTTCEVVPFQIPDRSEEYAINIHGGWGTVDASPTLENGWNLTGLSTKTDSKGPETITALSSLLTAAANSANVIQGRDALTHKQSTTKPPFACTGVFAPQYEGGQFVGFRRISLS